MNDEAMKPRPSGRGAVTWDDHDAALATLMAQDAKATQAVMRGIGMLDGADDPLPMQPRGDVTAQAVEMLRAGTEPAEVRRALKLTWNEMEKANRHVRGLKPKGAKPGQGRHRSPESVEAERLLRGGMSARDVSEATGISRTLAQRLARTIREEREAA